MRFENPFFLKEIRALSRKAFAPLSWIVLAQVLLVICAFWPLEYQVDLSSDPMLRALRRGMAGLLLAACHGLGCGAAGWILGGRIFVEEHRQQTLEGLQLISAAPWRWLPQKLLFPLYGLFLVWLAPLPVYAALAIRGHFFPHELAPAAVLAGCAGLLTMGAALLAPPGGLRSQRNREERFSLAALREDGPHLMLPYWIGLILFRMVWDWVMGFNSPARQSFKTLPFYETTLRTDAGLALLLFAFGMAALAAGLASADPAAAWVRTAARWTRSLAIGVAYYLWVGYTWAGDGMVARGVKLAGLGVAALVFYWLRRRKKRQRREDPLTARELGWLGFRMDNPVLIRDLRVSLRGSGMRRRTLGRIFGFFGSLGLVLFWQLYSNDAFLGDDNVVEQAFAVTRMIALTMSVWLGLPALLTLGSRAHQQWQAERRANTLSQLAMTPLSSAAIVRGRWGASLLVGATQVAPLFLVFLVGLSVFENDEGRLRALITACWVGTLGVVLSAGMAGAARPRLSPLGGVFSAVGLATLVVGAEFAGTIFLVTHILPNSSSSEAIYACWLVFTLLNCVLTLFVYRRAIADIEIYRARDLE